MFLHPPRSPLTYTLFPYTTLFRSPIGAPDEIGLTADDGIAAPRVAAFDRLQQEAVQPVMRDFQHGRDRGLEIGNETSPGHLRRALVDRKSTRLNSSH